VDEEGTLAALRAIRRELSDPKIKEHRGRIGFQLAPTDPSSWPAKHAGLT
jgi:hypothetical protein